MSLIFVAPAFAAGIDETIDRAIAPVADRVADFIFFSVPFFGAELPLIVAWLVIGADFFTFLFGFINVRGFIHAIGLVSGRYADPNHPGEVSHFQALATAVSGTVGIGNIGGVAITISLGAMIQLDSFLKLADALIFVMALPNVLGLYLLAPIVKWELLAYQEMMRNQLGSNGDDRATQ